MITRFAPRTESKVRRISSSRDCVRTWIVTSSGIKSSSTSLRTKSKSVCDAEGNPTSISLNPIFTSCRNMRSFRSASIGSISAWLPSRKSVDSQIGGRVIVCDGQRRSGRSIGGNGWYFFDGSASMTVLVANASDVQQTTHPVSGGAGTALKRGEVLSARGAQQQQTAEDGDRGGRCEGKGRAAHKTTIAGIAAVRNGRPRERPNGAGPVVGVSRAPITRAGA